MEAINLYLKAGLPAKAARLAMSREVGLSDLLFVSSREGRDVTASASFSLNFPGISLRDVNITSTYTS